MAKQRIYIKHRPLGLDKMFGLSKNQFLNGEYTFDTWYRAGRIDYIKEAGITPNARPFGDDKYVDITNVSNKKRLGKEFGIIDFDDTLVDRADLEFDIDHDLSQFGVRVLTSVEAIAMVKDCFDNAKVIEVSDGKFLYESKIVKPDEAMGETIPVAGPEQDVFDNGDGTYLVKKYIDCNI